MNYFEQHIHLVSHTPENSEGLNPMKKNVIWSDVVRGATPPGKLLKAASLNNKTIKLDGI